MITQSVIDNINSSVSIVDLISSYVTLKPAGQSYMGRCPFHNENTPSFHVTDSKNLYKCFGCGASGDAIAFLQEHQRMSFYEAVEELAERCGIPVEYDKHYTALELEGIRNHKKEVEKCLNIAQQYYHNKLMGEPEDSDAWKYVLARGISRETVVDWQIGYAPNTWDNITTTLINAGLQRIGVDLGILNVRNGKTYDKYRNRLIIPSRNRNGQLNGFIGRIMETNSTEAKYYNPSDSELYNKSTELFGLNMASNYIREDGFAYLVEGNLDVVMMHQYGIKNTVGIGGTSLTSEQLKTLKRYTDVICIMTDGDAAGEKAAMKWIDLALNLDIKTQIVELPWGHDPDSYIRSLHNTVANDE